VRREAHFAALTPGTHLGYQRSEGTPVGRWLFRRCIGSNRYQVTPLGPADDEANANGITVLSYEQAQSKALRMVETPNVGKIERMTVRQAFALYVDHKRDVGQSPADVSSRGAVHILPFLGDLVISELTAEKLRRWLANMANAPAQLRPKEGKPQYRAAPEGDEAIRKRRATANRVLTMLKAMLNFAYDEGHVSNRDAWGRKLKPFKDMDAARVRYLSMAEATRFINACDPEFRPIARAALESGARYGELGRMEVCDFNPDSGSLAVRKSKTHRARHIILTNEGAAFFTSITAGRAAGELIFSHTIAPNMGDPVPSPWKSSHQQLPMQAANEHAKLDPPISFHTLRHTWASHAVMNGVPLIIVAKNLGHKDTRMVERVYGHLAPSYVTDAIRAGGPKYGVPHDDKVKVIR
jgi:integrase